MEVYDTDSNSNLLLVLNWDPFSFPIPRHGVLVFAPLTRLSCVELLAEMLLLTFCSVVMGVVIVFGWILPSVDPRESRDSWVTEGWRRP